MSNDAHSRHAYTFTTTAAPWPSGARDKAMISRIRVEARGGSMDACRRVIETLMGHAQMAGYLEGIAPQVGVRSDDHFGEVLDGPDGWHELGLNFEGRQAYRFEPEIVDGGLRQFGLKIEPVNDQGEDGPAVLPPNNGHGFFALDRANPVTREHTWERSSAFGSLDEPTVREGGEEPNVLERPRHDRRGPQGYGEKHLLGEVYVMGVEVPGGKDKPTRIVGQIIEACHTSPTTGEGGSPVWEYQYDLMVGDDVDAEVEVVYEKVLLVMDAIARERGYYTDAVS